MRSQRVRELESQRVRAVAEVSMSGEEELGALGGADGALGGGVHSPDAEGLPEGGEVWVSKLGVSFVAGVLPGLAGRGPWGQAWLGQGFAHRRP